VSNLQHRLKVRQPVAEEGCPDSARQLESRRQRQQKETHMMKFIPVTGPGLHLAGMFCA
jgi:hypothetical protein